MDVACIARFWFAERKCRVLHVAPLNHSDFVALFEMLCRFELDPLDDTVYGPERQQNGQFCLFEDDRRLDPIEPKLAWTLC